MNPTDIAERCRAFIERNFLYMRPGFVLEGDTSLMEQGILDSMGVMELIEFLEGESGIRVGEDEIIEENLGTLNAIAAFAAARVARTSPGAETAA
jgi:acyl carrier protein